MSIQEQMDLYLSRLSSDIGADFLGLSVYAHLHFAVCSGHHQAPLAVAGQI